MLKSGCRIHLYKQYFAVGRKKEKQNGIETAMKPNIVFTASKDIDGFYCSQCCHIAEGLFLSQECKILLFVAQQNNNHP